MALTDSLHGDDTALGSDAVMAAVIVGPGVEPRVGRIALPPRKHGTSLVSVLAAPLNPLDLLIASGNFHSVRHETAYTPGSECVGVVLESDRFPAGTRVYGVSRPSPNTPGTFAARTLMTDEDLLELPGEIDPVVAAAVGNSGIAAYLPLIEDAGLRAGDNVLILGATGAVGQIAIQLARRKGAGRIVAVARNGQALQRLLSLGADDIVEIRTGESAADLAARMRMACKSVDVVLDALFGVPLEAALEVCAPRARVVNIGNMAGEVAAIPAGLLRGRQITISGFAGIHISLQAKRAGLKWLWEAIARDELNLPVTTYPLAQFATAWQDQQASPYGKCVIVPGETGTSNAQHPTEYTHHTGE